MLANQMKDKNKSFRMAKNIKKKSKLQVWGFGELKIFEWVCLFISSFKDPQMSKPVKKHQIKVKEVVGKIKNIFVRKSLQCIRYEYTSFVKSKSNSIKQWREAEDQMLFHIIEEEAGLQQSKFKNSQWKHYSFLLFTRSKGKFYKTPKQCRQKWTNYLNPRVNHDPWSIQEDVRLFEYINERGFKWSLIAQLFGHQRTEHMVKNRFYSIAKSWKNTDRKQALSQQLVSDVLSSLYEQLKQQEVNQEGLLVSFKNAEENLQVVRMNQLIDQQSPKCQQIIKNKKGAIFHSYEYQESQPDSNIDQSWNQILQLNGSLDLQSQKYDKAQKRTQDDDQEHFVYEGDQIQNQIKGHNDIFQPNFRQLDPFIFDSWKERSNVNYAENEKGQNRIQLLKQVTDFLGENQMLKISSEDELLNQLEEKAQLEWLQ